MKIVLFIGYASSRALVKTRALSPPMLLLAPLHTLPRNHLENKSRITAEISENNGATYDSQEGNATFSQPSFPFGRCRPLQSADCCLLKYTSQRVVCYAAAAPTPADVMSGTCKEREVQKRNLATLANYLYLRG